MTPSGCINRVNWEESTFFGVRRTFPAEFLKAVAVGEGFFGVKFAGGVIIVVGLAAAGDTEGVIELFVVRLTTAG